jgi:hypothetical protein
MKTEWLRAALSQAKVRAGMHDADQHFHDPGGTAATKFHLADLSKRETTENPEIEGRPSRPHHPALCRPLSRNQGAHSSTEQAQRRNITVQNRQQNPSSDRQPSIGAGEGNRTLDTQLGKLMFYH